MFMHLFSTACKRNSHCSVSAEKKMCSQAHFPLTTSMAHPTQLHFKLVAMQPHLHHLFFAEPAVFHKFLLLFPFSFNKFHYKIYGITSTQINCTHFHITNKANKNTYAKKNDKKFTTKTSTHLVPVSMTCVSFKSAVCNRVYFVLFRLKVTPF